MTNNPKGNAMSDKLAEALRGVIDLYLVGQIKSTKEKYGFLTEQNAAVDTWAELVSEARAALSDYEENGGWRFDMDKAPDWKDVWLSTSEGLFLGRRTNLAEDLLTESECEASGMLEEDLFKMEWWLFGTRGVSRATDDSIDINAWMFPPPPPQVEGR